MKKSFQLQSLFLLAFLLFAVSFAFGQKRQNSPDPNGTYKVVINHEEQYSIWSPDRDNPTGWKDTGKTGSWQECMAYIEEVWTDMRPLSIRKQNLPSDTRYKVVINHEEQYSILPASQKAPKGWKPVSKPGNLKACMDYIEEVWTDMRPLSLRK